MAVKGKRKSNLPLVLGIAAILLVILAVFATLYFTGFFNRHIGQRNGFSGMGRQLNESQTNEVTNFFNSNPSSEEIKTYCNANRGSCFYYCRNVNPSTDYCAQLINSNHENFTRGNFSRRQPQ